MSIPTGTSVYGTGETVSSTKLALPRRFSTALSANLPEAVIGLDDYKRSFPIATSSMVQRAHHSFDAFKRSFHSFMARHKVQETGLKDKLLFSFSTSVTDQNLLGMGMLDMNYRLSDRHALRFSYRSDVLAEEMYFDRTLANPFLDMTDSYSLAHQFNLKRNLSLSFGGSVGKNGFFEGDKEVDEEYHRSVNAFQSEMKWFPSEKVGFKAVGGLISEKNALLGLNGSGAFETETTQTYFTGAVVDVKPMPNIVLSAAYYYGRSIVPKNGGLVSFDNVVSDSFAFDVRYQSKNRVTGIQFSSPLRIRGGHASFNLPVARDSYSDTVYREQVDISLKSKVREYNLGFYYAHENKDIDYRYELGARFNPDHMAGVKPDYRALFGVSFKY